MAVCRFAVIRRIPPLQPYDGLSLFGRFGNGKYLNAAERRRFVEAARRAPPKIRLFCLMLRSTEARISEVFAFTPAAIDIGSGVASIQIYGNEMPLDTSPSPRRKLRCTCTTSATGISSFNSTSRETDTSFTC
jgi:integrase